VLVATKDAAILGLVESMNRSADAASAAKLLAENAGKLFPRKDVKGLVRYGIDLNDKDRSKLASLSQNLAPDFIIINEGEKPNPGFSAAMLFIGLLLVGVQLKRLAS
jgi:hypothetical protein